MDRKQQLIQDALDGLLSDHEEQELTTLLDSDKEAASEMERQKTVDKVFNRPPHERAPERLAPIIMARIAQMVKQQQMQADDELNEMAEAMVNIAMTTVTVATLPLLVSASWLMLNARSKPEAVEKILAQITALMLLVIDVMRVMLEEAMAAMDDDPEAAMAMLALMPATLLLLVRQVLGLEEEEEEPGEDE